MTDCIIYNPSVELLTRLSSGLVLQVIIHAGHHTHILHVGSIAVAVGDGELALRSTLDLAQLAVAIGSKLLRCFAGILGGRLYHGRLYFIEFGKRIYRLILPTGSSGNTA